jgi:cytoskeletal protein RodZ
MKVEKRQVEQLQRDAREALSFGEILARERRLRGISLREVSDATKISVRHLESLERNDFDALPGGAFNKGFLRAYAVFIGLDPEEMVNHYLFEISRQRRRPEPEHGASPEELRRRFQRRLVLAVGGVLLLAAAALLLWWGGSIFRA